MKVSLSVATYIYMMSEPRPSVARTIQIDSGLLVDVDDEGRVIGVESIGPQSADWYGVLRHPDFRFVGGSTKPGDIPDQRAGEGR